MSKALPTNFDTVKLAAPPWSQGARVKYFGNYELLEEIATGGMGVVWKARQNSLDRIVAVKMIRGGVLAGADEVQRFHAEAQAAANLKHPNIVGIHEIGEHEGQHYYSMDFIEGKSLADLCHGKPMNARESAALLRTICDAVNFAHQRGILHRDLKPHNIMLDAEGEPHVLDFGLAKRIDDDQGLTMSGAVLGSPSYMAPEQAQGRNDRVGPHTDVYALGAILYQLLTGRAPFLGGSAAETMMQVVQREPSAPSKLNADVPRDLETICLKCLEKEPARRYATARELSEELGRFLKGDPILAHPAGAARKTMTWLRHHPGLLSGIGALFVFGLLCAAFYLFQENAFLHARQLDPALERTPGTLTKILSQWIGFGGMVMMNLGLWVNLWFLKHARRTTWRGLFDQTRFRPLSPVPAHVRTIQSVAGVLCAAYGVMLIAKIIEAQVWEGGGPLPNHPSSTVGTHYFIAFCITWIGIWMLVASWRDYVRCTEGAPNRRIDDATHDAIRGAVEQMNFAGALKLYRRAVPEAGRLEANDYAMRIADEFRRKEPERYKSAFNRPWWDVNLQPMLIVAVIEIALGVVLWFAFTPAEPGPAAWSIFTGLLYGIAVVISSRLRGFRKKFLLFFSAMMLTMLAGEYFVGARPHSQMPLVLAGIAAGVCLMRAGYRRRRSAPVRAS